MDFWLYFLSNIFKLLLILTRSILTKTLFIVRGHLLKSPCPFKLSRGIMLLGETVKEGALDKKTYSDRIDKINNELKKKSKCIN